MNDNLPRVLVIAYACEPHKGSEQGIGWNMVRQIAKFAKVWVITRENNRSIIEIALSRNPVANLEFIYFDLPFWLRFWKRGSRGIYLYYLLWQAGVYFKGIKLCKYYNIHLIHYLTFANMWIPPLIGLAKIPLVWGPTGIHPYIPRNFKNDLSLQERLLNCFRYFVIKTMLVNPIVNLILNRTKKFIAINNLAAQSKKAFVYF